MRAGLGLLSLLICGLIVAYLWTNSASTATSALKTAQPTINRVTSKGPDGASSAQSANLIPYEPGGKLLGLKVVAVTPGGAMATTYGLAPGDIILQIYGFKIGDSSSASTESFEASKDFLFIDAYRAVVDPRRSRRHRNHFAGAAQLHASTAAGESPASSVGS